MPRLRQLLKRPYARSNKLYDAMASFVALVRAAGFGGPCQTDTYLPLSGVEFLKYCTPHQGLIAGGRRLSACSFLVKPSAVGVLVGCDCTSPLPWDVKSRLKSGKSVTLLAQLAKSQVRDPA